VGPPRFELESIPPQGTRMPSYPTGPGILSLKVVLKFNRKAIIRQLGLNETQIFYGSNIFLFLNHP